MQSRVGKSNYLVLRIQPVCNTRGGGAGKELQKKVLMWEVKEDRIL